MKFSEIKILTYWFRSRSIVRKSTNPPKGVYFQGVSLSAIGDWLGIHKSTACRWLSKVADWTKPLTPSKVQGE